VVRCSRLEVAQKAPSIARHRGATKGCGPSSADASVTVDRTDETPRTQQGRCGDRCLWVRSAGVCNVLRLCGIAFASNDPLRGRIAEGRGALSALNRVLRGRLPGYKHHCVHQRSGVPGP